MYMEYQNHHKILEESQEEDDFEGGTYYDPSKEDREGNHHPRLNDTSLDLQDNSQQQQY